MVRLSMLVTSVSREHTACCVNVHSARLPYGGDDPLTVERIGKFLNRQFGRWCKQTAGYGMEPDQVHTATKPCEQPHQIVRMLLGIVDACKHDVFEGYAALLVQIAGFQ